MTDPPVGCVTAPDPHVLSFPDTPFPFEVYEGRTLAVRCKVIGDKNKVAYFPSFRLISCAVWPK